MILHKGGGAPSKGSQDASPPIVLVARNGRIAWEDVRREFDARAFAVAGFQQVERPHLFAEAVSRALGHDTTMRSGHGLSFRGLKDALVRLFGEEAFYSERDPASAPPAPPAVALDDPALGAPPPPPPAAPVRVARAVAAEERPVPPQVECCGAMLYKDVIFCIFLHLDVPTLLAAGRVCRLFALMAREDNLWKRFNEASMSAQFAQSLRLLKSCGQMQFSFTGAEKRVYKGRCRDLFARMGQTLTCCACHKGVKMTPEYWRKFTVVQFYRPLHYRNNLVFCCADCTGKRTTCRNCPQLVLCTEEVLRESVAQYSDDVRCGKCMAKWG